MDQATRERLFGFWQAFDDPVTRGICGVLLALLLLAPVLMLFAQAAGRTGPQQKRELWARYFSWCVLVPLMLVPILLGAFWTILAVFVLSALAFREFAGAVDLRREKRVMFSVYAGVVAIALASLDHWYGLFAALLPLGAGAIAALAILDDRPQGYVQRVSLGVWGFALFGCGLGHLGFMSNDARFRPLILLVLLSVELNDVFAYCCGKLFGQRKIAIHTSPNKTLGGSLGALALTTLLIIALGRYVFADSPMARLQRLFVLGVLISLLGQLGDLMLSSVKRDIGVKDLGHLIPGHGGLLDRFDSLLLVAPAVFHYVHYVRGIGTESASRIFF